MKLDAETLRNAAKTPEGRVTLEQILVVCRSRIAKHQEMLAYLEQQAAPDRVALAELREHEAGVMAALSEIEI